MVLRNKKGYLTPILQICDKIYWRLCTRLDMSILLQWLKLNLRHPCVKTTLQCPSLYWTNLYTHLGRDQKNLIYWMEVKQPCRPWMQQYTMFFSHEEPIVITSQSFESLLPGKEIDESVCDLCLKLWVFTRLQSFIITYYSTFEKHVLTCQWLYTHK